MGGVESSTVLPQGSKADTKSLDISRDVTHRSYIKHVEGDLNQNCLTEFPWDLRDCITLYERVNASFNLLTSVPEEIPLRIPHLTKLILSHNRIVSLPDTFRLFFHLRELALDHNELNVLPQALTQLLTLEKLDVSYNHLHELPQQIGNMESLARLNLNHNSLTVLPETLSMCPLKVLLAHSNKLVKPLQDVCNQGSSATLVALRQMSRFDSVQTVRETLEFPRVRGSQVLVSSYNPGSMAAQYSQLQEFPDKIKTPLIPSVGATALDLVGLKDRIIGLIYGAAIGDALGVGTEHLSRDECHFHYNPSDFSYEDIIRDEHRTKWRRGDWTTTFDQMMLVLDSLLQWAGVADELDFARRLSDWCAHRFPELGDKNGINFSSTIETVVSDVDFLTDPHRVSSNLVTSLLTLLGEKEESIENYADDSALARAIILGIPHFENIDEVMENSVRICKTTHSDSRCVTASAMLSTVVALLLQGKHEGENVTNIIHDALDYSKKYLEGSCHKVAFIDHMALNLTNELMNKQNYCLKSLCITLQSLHWKKDFRSTVLKVILQGGDCKVTATLTGALHGCLCGYSGLPKQWVTGLLPKQTQWLNAKINHLLDLMAIP